MAKSYSIYILSLGCSKNLVDSQVMAGVLSPHFNITDSPGNANVIIINTCGFIEAAQKESIEAILDLAEYKKSGSCVFLAVVGCMVEKFAADMKEAMPEIDFFLGSNEYQNIAALLSEKLELSTKSPAVDEKNIYLLRAQSVEKGSTYIKIADGCNNHCSYCLIPSLKGPYKSRLMEDIVVECKALIAKGAKELNVIAQDSTYYGLDVYGRPMLAPLLEKLAGVGLPMLRLFYAYPERIDEALLSVMKNQGNICRYLDMPVQHASGEILRAMQRSGNADTLLKKISLIRTFMPDMALRTTVMVGFPGETEENFQDLMAFLRLARFQWLGAFTYSQEAGTLAASMPNQITEEIKAQRLEAVMNLSAEITTQALRGYVGQKLTVLAEAEVPELGEGWFSGRSQYHGPEVDGLIYFQGGKAVCLGELYQVKITDSDVYDLTGELI